MTPAELEEMSALMRYHDGTWGAGDWLVMGAMMVLFWGLVIGLAIWVAHRWRSGDHSPHAEGSDPGSALAERLARGELDEDEGARQTAAASAKSPADGHTAHGAAL